MRGFHLRSSRTCGDALLRLLVVFGLTQTALACRSGTNTDASAGASWLCMARRIVLPQIRVGLLAAWVIAFVLSFGELGASILVAPPGESTLPVRVYTLIANTPSSHVATLALLQVAAACGPLAIFGLALSMREGNQR